MPIEELTCAQADDADYDTRYLAGALSDVEAEQFESHYFGCDRCWALVRSATDARSGMVGEAQRIGTQRRWALWTPALAAGIAAIAIGGSLWLRPRALMTPSVVERGAALGDGVTLLVSGDSVFVRWPRVANAVLYRLRLYTAQGALLYEKELRDTSAVVRLSALPARPTLSYWSVEALDGSRGVLSHTPLVLLRLPRSAVRPP
ncbi:MAG: zf-HC2 domain-containing protein [Gemmatimonadota bacterium]|nr:zf-HC2 domain-containing protein [Gemmatimonadota bacterium]